MLTKTIISKARNQPEDYPGVIEEGFRFAQALLTNRVRLFYSCHSGPVSVLVHRYKLRNAYLARGSQEAEPLSPSPERTILRVDALLIWLASNFGWSSSRAEKFVD